MLLRVSCACVAGVALGDVWPRVLVWLPAFYSGSWPIAGAGLLLFFAKRSRSSFLCSRTNVFSSGKRSQEVTHSMCLCVRKKVLVLIKVKFSVFVQTFTKRSLNYLVAVTQNLAKTGERFLRFEMEPCFSVRYVYLLVAPHFQFRFHVWWNCFSGKKQFNDRPLSNLLSVAVEEKFTEVVGLISPPDILCPLVFFFSLTYNAPLIHARKKRQGGKVCQGEGKLTQQLRR